MKDEGREADLAIDNLDHLGRDKQKPISARRKRDCDASKGRILDMLRQRERR
ncbi:MAG: hypothetical protein Q4G26_04025 [Paracoccus sp. (in: a-proteobacteria)]|nr:hypothetical protein [Paracoccus sp. (in: a-proteobacteria)]